MSQTFLAFIRGINVGGRNIVRMAQLRDHLENDGFKYVATYIQSGNILFDSKEDNLKALGNRIEACLNENFGVNTAVKVFSRDQWQSIIETAPDFWGKSSEWKHNIFILLTTIPMEDVLSAIGEINPDIEAVAAGDSVVYQSMSQKYYNRTAIHKLPQKPIYQQLTIRNYNTATKLLQKLSKG